MIKRLIGYISRDANTYLLLTEMTKATSEYVELANIITF